MRGGSKREQVQDVEAQDDEYLQQANQTGPKSLGKEAEYHKEEQEEEDQ